MSERRWTDEEATAAYDEADTGYIVDIGRALLELRSSDAAARERAEKAEALIAVLKAECRAWRDFDAATEDEGVALMHAPLYDAIGAARAATDALGGVE